MPQPTPYETILAMEPEQRHALFHQVLRLAVNIPLTEAEGAQESVTISRQDFGLLMLLASATVSELTGPRSQR